MVKAKGTVCTCTSLYMYCVQVQVLCQPTCIHLLSLCQNWPFTRTTFIFMMVTFCYKYLDAVLRCVGTIKPKCCVHLHAPPPPFPFTHTLRFSCIFLCTNSWLHVHKRLVYVPSSCCLHQAEQGQQSVDNRSFSAIIIKHHMYTNVHTAYAYTQLLTFCSIIWNSVMPTVV